MSVRLSAPGNAKHPQSPLGVLVCVLQVVYIYGLMRHKNGSLDTYSDTVSYF